MSADILEYTWKLGDKSWFDKKYLYHSCNPDVIDLSEERRWKKIEVEMIQDEKNHIAQSVIWILRNRKKKKSTAKIIQFPQEKIA